MRCVELVVSDMLDSVHGECLPEVPGAGIRVLFVIDSLAQGGAERSQILCANGMVALGWKVEFVIFNAADSHLLADLSDSGIQVTELSFGNVFRDAYRLSKIANRFNPDVVWSCLYKTVIRSRLMRAMRPQTKLLESIVGIVHNRPAEHIGLVRYLKQRVRRAVDRATSRLFGMHYHAISEAVATHAARSLGIERTLITVIHRGREPAPAYDLEDRLSVRREVFGAEDGECVFLIVGRQEFIKNHAAVLAAAGLLRRQNKLDGAKFVFVGREGAASAELRRKVLAEGLESSFTFVGFRDDVPRLLNAGDAFLLPSWSEGLGGSAIEAMAAGLPVLCSDLPALRELSALSSGFIFFDPSSPSEVAASIVAVLEEPEMAEEMGRANREVFHARYELAPVQARMNSLAACIAGRPG